jgi:hypothetical protein
LTDAQARVVDELRRDGVTTIAFDELFSDSELWSVLADDIGGFVSETESRLPGMSAEERKAEFRKTFLVRRFQVTRGHRHEVGLDDPWIRYGVSPEILGVVNAYRGLQVRLEDFDNWYTVPEPDTSERVSSQQWHRDGWEDHIVKVFTYFNDVDAGAGPFEYVRGSSSGGKYGSLWPWEKNEVYPDQEELDAAIEPSDFTSLTGQAGTIVFCDTGGFHRGGFARTSPRILSYHTFISPEAAERMERKFTVDWAADDGTLSPESRFALE